MKFGTSLIIMMMIMVITDNDDGNDDNNNDNDRLGTLCRHMRSPIVGVLLYSSV